MTASGDCTALGNTPMIWMLALVACGVLAMLSIGAYTLRTGISPMPTTPRVRRVLLNALPARLEGAVYELGAGWGTLAFPLARRYPGCPVLAYELSPLPWLWCRLRQALARAPNLALRRKDFHRAHLGDAALVVCYLYPEGMERLRPKLEAELPIGALVVSNTFAVPGWSPVAVHRVGDLWASRIYVYQANRRRSQPAPEAG